MKKITMGILAHVDSGKTTLSEAILYKTGVIRRLGRVDKKDAFLDNDAIERERGITVFSKQAEFTFGATSFSLLDTPGHVDFSAEAERTLFVLDCAVLVVGGNEKLQSHTETLWRLLKNYGIPTFIFVNKMDLSLSREEEILKNLTERLDSGCVSFADTSSDEFYESLALTDEYLLEKTLGGEKITDSDISRGIAARHVFPVLFGSALKTDGVEALLSALDRFTLPPESKADFSARVYKITQDERGTRLTHMKITGGSLAAKAVIANEKVNEIRIYSGVKYKTVAAAPQGTVCSVTGLDSTYPGQGLGSEKNALAPRLAPVFSYKVILPPDKDKMTVFRELKTLSEEESELNVTLNEDTGDIELGLMGEVQSEVIRELVKTRFNTDINFAMGTVIYKETILDTVEGVGHYEPLRHYAEVHLKMEPALSGEGLVFESECSEEVLPKNFQRLVLTHLAEKTHRGVLTGAPITDIKITLVSGRAHLKHTEGGDFRQATYRAVRQGLMQAQSVLLEPWYDFEITLPQDAVGRALTDLDLMGAEIEAPESAGEMSVIRGSAPISAIHGYDSSLTSYTKGRGRLVCSFRGYGRCKNQDEVVSEIGYDPESDVKNSPDSVFCAGGAGFVVKWNEVPEYMHLKYEKKSSDSEPVKTRGGSAGYADEEELIRIFEATYGKIRRREAPAPKEVHFSPEKPKKSRPNPEGPAYLLIDGYNIIFADDALKKAASESLEAARKKLCDKAACYRAVRDTEVIVVFDAYRVKNNPGSMENENGITIVYTKEAETADTYIERVTHSLSKNHRVTVATSDSAEQMIILGNGAYRISAAEFMREIAAADKEIASFIEDYSIESRMHGEKVLNEEVVKRVTDGRSWN